MNLQRDVDDVRRKIAFEALRTRRAELLREVRSSPKLCPAEPSRGFTDRRQPAVKGGAPAKIVTSAGPLWAEQLRPRLC